MTDQKTIDYLSTDSAFGILTRQALEIAISNFNDGRVIYVIDFTDIHGLNERLGYQKVNEIFTNIFSHFRAECPSVVIGRVFSGDEVAVISPRFGHKTKLETLQETCETYNIGFKYTSHETRRRLQLWQARQLLDLLSTKLQKNPNYLKV